MILVMGGTSDSLKIGEYLSERGLSYRISVTTAYGKELAEEQGVVVYAGKRVKEQLEDLYEEAEVDLVIDATHPYAIIGSCNAMKACVGKGISYIRYERPSLLEEVDYAACYTVSSITEACQKVRQIGGRVLLTTGSKDLAIWVSGLEPLEVVVRVLPIQEALEACENTGITPNHIIAMKGPFSKALNQIVLKDYHIDVMVTKESGHEGRFLEKVAACQEEGIPLVVVVRPRLEYPACVNSLEQLDVLLRNYSEKGRLP
ncbi:MAG: precorrin-6A reductase [Cellulosilyticaceae bacterium]